MINQLEIHLDEDIAYPPNLLGAHDDLVNITNEKKLEKLNVDFKNSVDELTELQYENNMYSIIAPMRAADIYSEGRNLSHCVGTDSYITGHAKRETTILFIRNVGSPGKSLYTLEFRNMKIVQCRGKSNKSAPKEVYVFIEEWVQHLNKNGLVIRNSNAQ